MAKGGTVSVTRELARELAPKNIRVNCLCPGTIDTPMLDHFLQRHDNPEQARQHLLGRRPLARLGRPDDVAFAALYMASDEAVCVTGTTLPIDGGSTA